MMWITHGYTNNTAPSNQTRHGMTAGQLIIIYGIIYHMHEATKYTAVSVTVDNNMLYLQVFALDPVYEDPSICISAYLLFYSSISQAPGIISSADLVWYEA